MQLGPSRAHTIVTGWTRSELLIRMANYTQEVDSEYITEKPSFNGRILENGFRISSVVKTPQNALPLIVGQLEESSRGTIVLLTMKLFPAAVLYLIAFSLLSAIIGLIFLFMAGFKLAAFLSFSIGLLNYVILTINFHRHAERSVAELERLLEKTDP